MVAGASDVYYLDFLLFAIQANFCARVQVIPAHHLEIIDGCCWFNYLHWIAVNFCEYYFIIGLVGLGKCAVFLDCCNEGHVCWMVSEVYQCGSMFAMHQETSMFYVVVVHLLLDRGLHHHYVFESQHGGMIY